MLFTYKAKTNTGEIFDGTMESKDRFVLARELRSRGYTPLSITEKGSTLYDKFTIFSGFLTKVSISEKILFTKNLSEMLKAGLSLLRALSVLQKQSKNPKYNQIILSLIADLNAGAVFSSALSKFGDVFSPFFISMVRSGEESGNLSGALHDIGVNLEKNYSLSKKVRGALIYPSIIVSSMIIIGILMFAFVVPTLAQTFADLGVELPFSTRVLIFLGNFFSNYLIVSFAIITSFLFAIFALIRAKFMAPYVDFIAIRFPLAGTLAKELNIARTARTLSSLLSSGVSINKALEITENVVQNIYYKQALNEAKDAIEKGAPFSKVLKKHEELYFSMMPEMAEVGEETGKLSPMLGEIASFYEEDIDNKTKNLSTVVEPLLMIVVGFGVGFFAMSIISPLYTILDSIK